MNPVPIGQALDERREALMALPKVVGTAVGLADGSPCIQVFLIEDDPETRRRIPDQIRGHPVEVRVTGRFRPREG